MGDIPLAPPTPSPSTAATAAATPGLVAVQVSITNVPVELQNLTRTIQANATPLIVSDANNLTLATILGNITVALSQQLGNAEKQSLTQQLISLMQVQRSLTLTLQPGSPPTQGALLFPMTTFPTSIQNVQGRPFSHSSAAQAQNLTAGSAFHAVVLPPLPAPAVVLAEAPSSATLTTLAGLRPINPPPLTENIYTVFMPLGGNSDLPATNIPPTNAVRQTAVLPSEIPPAQSAYSFPQADVPPVSQKPAGVQQVVSLNAAEPPSPIAQPTPPASSTSIPVQQTTLPGASQPLPPVSQTPPSQAPSAPIPIQKAQGPPLAQQPQTTLPPIQPIAVSPKAATPVPTASLPPEATILFPSVQQQPQVPPHISSLLKPGNEVSLHVVSVLSGSAEAAARQAIPPTLAPNQIVATVSGTGTDGQLILKAGDATLFVKAQITAPAGTSMIVSVDEVKNSSFVTLPQSEQPAFPSLPQVLAALEQISPRVLQNVMLNFLPRPTDALPGSLIFLLSAFGQGNVRNWLGDNTVDVLANSGKSGIVRSLSKELAGAGQPAQDAVVGEWRSYPIPLYAGQQFQSLTLYVHSDRDARKDKSQKEGIGKIRFLIDMRLSKLGAMQIDGFVQQKKLDMILRSENVLPEGLHQELRRGYIKALDAVGYAGTLNFQVGRHHWMVMQKSAPPGIVT